MPARTPPARAGRKRTRVLGSVKSSSVMPAQIESKGMLAATSGLASSSPKWDRRTSEDSTPVSAVPASSAMGTTATIAR